MPKGTKGEPTKRRDFLKLASASVPAAAVAAAAGTTAQAATVEDTGEGPAGHTAYPRLLQERPLLIRGSEGRPRVARRPAAVAT